MTLAAGSPINSYLGTGGTNSYPFTFPVFSSGDLTVSITSPTGTNYVLALTTDFTVSGLNPTGAPPTTGSITLVNSSQAWLTAGFLTSGWTLTIERIVSIAQATSIRNQGDFYQEVLESALDYVVMICQQLQLQATTPTAPTPFTITGDITTNTSGAGFVCVDPVTGIKYRIRVNNGILGAETA